MNIEFLATVAVIAPDPMNSRSLYVEALGLPLQGEGDGYYHSEQIAGCKSFGIWPLSQAAQACFGSRPMAGGATVPQVSIEFDVPMRRLLWPRSTGTRQAGYDLLHEAREEPWGQTVARLQSPEGAIIGIAYTPVLHD